MKNSMNKIWSKGIIALFAIGLMTFTSVNAQTGYCIGDSVSLDAGMNYEGTIQWQISYNGVSFQDIPGAITDPYVHTLSRTAWYRASVRAKSCDPFYSDTMYLTASKEEFFSQNTSAGFSQNTTSGLDTTGNVVSLVASGNLNLGTGNDGAYSTSGNANLKAGVYNYSSFTIASGDTVFVTDTVGLEIFCTGSATINGVLYLQGEDGEDTDNNMPPGNGGAGGGGGGYAGGDGGDAGVTTSATYHGQDGLGPGGGIGGETEYTSSNDGQGGGGGGHDTTGGDSYHAGSGTGVGGSAYGNRFITTLVGGSGGGGGGADDDVSGTSSSDDGGGGGGGGGGAVKLSANSISVGSNGHITADGGGGGSCGNGGSGGGGSGGAIYLVSYSITNNGDITAEGGISKTDQYTNSKGGDGSDGRIRMDYISLTNNGNIAPAIGHNGPAGTFNSGGTMETADISVSGLCAWGTLVYNVDTSGTGVSLQVDVLNSSGSAIASNVASGTDLSTLPAVAAVTTIRLKVTMATTNNTSSPFLYDWRVNYTTR